MCGTVVRRCSSAAMPLRLSSSTPMDSRPRFSTFGPRPTETNIRSHSTVSPSPKWTVRPPPVSSTFVHCFSRWRVISRRPNCLASSFEASSSSWGISLGSISMIVTSVPKRLKIEANSQPMMPPPRMTSRLGTSVWPSRASESMQRGESSPSIGGQSGDEPVATIALLKVTSSPPSTPIVFASVNLPVPPTHSTPFDLNRLATPDVIWLTTCDFHSFAVGKSSVGGPTWTPSLPNVCSASLSENAVCTQAFVGMHPIRRQVPPSSDSFSMQIVLAPSCAVRMAAVYPPGPPPRTATSHSTGANPSRGRLAERRSHNHRAVVLAQRLEAVPLVEVHGGVVLGDTEADRLEAVLAGAVHQARQQLVPEAAAPATRDDG